MAEAPKPATRTAVGTASSVAAATATGGAGRPNLLYYGDNLDVLERHIADESIDLIYLDPPFNSNADYNVLYSEQDGTRAAAQIKAFEDTWRWDEAAVRSYQKTVEAGGDVAQALTAFRTMIGESNMLAYLSMMAPRLVEMRKKLRPTGSIYLHCDPTASHYLKLLMDAVFGPDMFVNEIVWHYRKWPTGKYGFQRNHDVLLFYSRSESKARVFNQLFMERAPSTLRRFGTAKITSGHDEEGRRVPSVTGDEESEGVRMDDVWNIGRVPPIKQLFPTEKPIGLLQRVVEASSNPGDVVLDPFCGCGTAVVAAQALGREWIGIDITHLAVNLIKTRLKDVFGAEIAHTYTVVGEPTTEQDAAQLASEDPYQFQAWALGLVGARLRGETKKGADGGVDGRLFFHDEIGGKTKQIIISVKAGKVSSPAVRELKSVVAGQKAEMGLLISFQKPTKDMRAEAADAGTYESAWGKHPAIQLLTVGELLAGAKVDFPAGAVNVTMRKAGKVALTSPGTQTGMFGAAAEPVAGKRVLEALIEAQDSDEPLPEEAD